MRFLLRLFADPVMLLSRWTLDKLGAYAEKRTAHRTGSTRVLIPDRLAKVTPLDLPDPSDDGVATQPNSWKGCLGCFGCLSVFLLLSFLSFAFWYISYVVICSHRRGCDPRGFRCLGHCYFCLLCSCPLNLP